MVALALPVATLSVAEEYSDTHVTIPLLAGLIDGSEVLYAVTGASDSVWNDAVTQKQGTVIEIGVLQDIPLESANILYVFTNGPEGDGLRGYQNEVFEYTPEKTNYTSISRVVEVTWNGEPATLRSATEVSSAASAGNIMLNDTGVALSIAQIAWTNGQLDIVNEEAGRGQMLELDRQERMATFMTRSALDSDGQPIHYIITDATSMDAASNLGVLYSNLPAGNYTTDMFQFTNSEPSAGFQPDIVIADNIRVPYWLVHNITWTNPQDANIVTTAQEIDNHLFEGAITATPTYIIGASVVNFPPILGGVDLRFASPLLGDPNAEVTIIEFGDYQCPNCRRWFDNTKPVIEMDHIQTGQANLYFVDLVFKGPDSSTAAAATYCAQEQQKYWEFHDILYENQQELLSNRDAHELAMEFAEEISLDLEEFGSCLERDHSERIQFNREQATQAGFNHTPSFVLVGPGGMERVAGNQPYQVFDRIINAISSTP